MLWGITVVSCETLLVFFQLKQNCAVSVFCQMKFNIASNSHGRVTKNNVNSTAAVHVSEIQQATQSPLSMYSFMFHLVIDYFTIYVVN